MPASAGFFPHCAALMRSLWFAAPSSPDATFARAIERYPPMPSKTVAPASTRPSKAETGARLFQVPKEADSARPRKLGEVIAYAIKRDIAEMGWPVGEVLGNQVELMQRYGISRSTLREAVRQIERHGVARMRRGVNGGLVIQQPARDSVVLAVASYLELAAVSLPELFEAREVIEALMIGVLCERATDADIRRLRTLLDELLAADTDDMLQEAARHLALRSAIASLSRNAALSLLLESLYRVTSDMLTVAGDHPRVQHLIRESRREKRELIEAVINGDEVQARLALRSAAQRSREQAELKLRKLRRKFETASALTLGVDGHAPDAHGALPKLGHRVSLRIAHDIAAARLKPGSRLGAEPEVRERYGVSRAVFREAVRTLELHNIVHVRRGLGGGLVVGEPDPSYTVELTSIYFQYARLKPRHFYELWRAIQTAAAQLAARRIDDAGRARLAAVLALQQHEVRREDMLAVHGRLHKEISELSGNRVIALFTRIMDEIGAHYSAEVPPQDIWKAFSDSHVELVGAITAGESALARRLMTRHLKLVDAWYGEAPRIAWLQSLGQADAAAQLPAPRRKKPAARKGKGKN